MPPVHDNFADALTLVTPGSFTVSNTDATTETGETLSGTPSVGGSTWFIWGTIWYDYTPTVDGTLDIATSDEGGGDAVSDTVIAVYTGAALNALTPVASDDDSGPGRFSALSMAVTAGVTYRVQIGSYDGTWRGDMIVTWTGPVGVGADESGAGALFIALSPTLSVSLCCGDAPDLSTLATYTTSPFVSSADAAGTYDTETAVWYTGNPVVDEGTAAWWTGGGVDLDPGPGVRATLATGGHIYLAWDDNPGDPDAGTVGVLNQLQVPFRYAIRLLDDTDDPLATADVTISLNFGGVVFTDTVTVLATDPTSGFVFTVTPAERAAVEAAFIAGTATGTVAVAVDSDHLVQLMWLKTDLYYVAAAVDGTGRLFLVNGPDDVWVVKCCGDDTASVPLQVVTGAAVNGPCMVPYTLP